MLALMAGLLLPHGNPLPSPYLPGSFRPIMPVKALSDLAPLKVIRGNFWQRGGYVRLSFLYALGDRKFDLKRIAEGEGFILSGSFGLPPNNRYNRIKDNVIQTIATLRVDGPEPQGWPSILEPGKYVMVNEYPIAGRTPKRWHPREVTMDPPLPPNYPCSFNFGRDERVYQVFSDPVLALFYRPTVSVQVIVQIPRTYEEVAKETKSELLKPKWRTQESPGNLHFFNEKDKYGLTSITLDKFGDGTTANMCRLMYGFTYEDVDHGPRIE